MAAHFNSIRKKFFPQEKSRNNVRELYVALLKQRTRKKAAQQAESCVAQQAESFTSHFEAQSPRAHGAHHWLEA